MYPACIVQPFRGVTTLAPEITSENNVSADDIRMATESALLLSRAYRNVLMYPLDHTMCRRFMEDLTDHLNRAIPEDRSLRFDVEKQHLRFHGTKVWEDTADESLPMILFRDGILWIEFLPGIERGEIQTFFEIIRTYRHIDEESEGDIVTALWGADFRHFRYEASDISWDTKPATDFPLNTPTETSGDAQAPRMTADPPPSKTVSLVGRDRSLWRLTPEEAERLKQMVREEEQWDHTDALATVLLLILTEQEQSDYFEAILTFIAEEFQLALEQRDLRLAAYLARKISGLRKLYDKQRPWAIPSIDMFFKIISSPDVLKHLTRNRPHLEDLSPDDRRRLKEMLTLLYPRAISSLAPLMTELINPAIRKIVMESIGILAGRDIESLETQFTSDDDAQVRQLVFILSHLNHERTVPLLHRMLSHTAESVRMEALKAILARDAGNSERLFRLIHDPGPAIRRRILNHFGKQRNRTVEALLLEYLESRRYNKDDAAHILDCYQTLGRCGSEASLPFLKRVLLGTPWRHLLKMNTAVEREGAALALKSLTLPEAKDLLEKGRGHFFSSVRSACERAEKGWR